MACSSLPLAVLVGRLADRDQLDSTVTEACLVDYGVFPTTAEPVVLPDQDCLESGSGSAGVVNHLGKPTPGVDAPALGLIDVLTHQGVAFFL